MDIRSIAPGSVETQRNRLNDAIEELLPNRTDARPTSTETDTDRVAISSSGRDLAANDVGDGDLSFARLALRHSGATERREYIRAIQERIEKGSYLTDSILESVTTSLEEEFVVR